MVRRFIGGILIVMGIGLFLYPYVAEALFDASIENYVQEFQEMYGLSGEDGISGESMMQNAVSELTDTDEGLTQETSDVGEQSQGQEEHAGSQDEGQSQDQSQETDQGQDLVSLYEQCLEYNQRIYEEGQVGFCDAWSYEQAAVEVDAEAFGYIEIPAMDLTLPLYLGASESNMAKGATVLGETSIPIGGENTNAVIAGHRGYRGLPYFREIEKLSVGDAVSVTNPWGTLTYRVSAIDIIIPSDADAVKIQEGKDMITLITCHPYRSHGKYRYVVYCERVEADDGKDAQMASDSQDTSDYLVASDGTAYALSSRDIQFERIFRIVCAGVLFLILAVSIYLSIRRRYTPLNQQAGN